MNGLIHHWLAIIGIWMVCLAWTTERKSRSRLGVVVIGLLFWSRLKMLTDLSTTALC